jgi:hypothetical protein
VIAGSTGLVATTPFIATDVYAASQPKVEWLFDCDGTLQAMAGTAGALVGAAVMARRAALPLPVDRED